MDRVLTIVLAGGAGERLHPLTQERAKPAVPFGAIYRIIDFTLSNCINSGLRRVYVLTQYKSDSLTRHIGNAWDMLSHSLGEFIDIVPPQMRIDQNWYLGTANAIFQNLYAIDRVNPEEVLILSGDHIYKMDYRKMIYFHRRQEAEVCISAIEVPMAEASRFGLLQVDEHGRVLRFAEKPADPSSFEHRPGFALASMGVYIFSAKTLREACHADSQLDTSHDFGSDVIPSLIDSRPVYAYPFEDENHKAENYWRDVGTIDAYFEANMDLIQVDPQFNLYDKHWPLRSNLPILPPAKFVFGDAGERFGAAVDSIVGPGCVVSGGMVRRSILSPEVRVNSYCEVENSILLDRCNIGRHSRIQRTIIEKGIQIPEGTVIGFDPEEDARRFTVSPSGVVVVSKDDFTRVDLVEYAGA